MKTTSLLLIVLSALSLASCSDEEPVDVARHDSASNTIAFRSGMAGRASETTNANLEKIYVTAFNNGEPYFSNILFEKGSDSFFTSAKKYSWLENKQQIDFIAFSPSIDDLGADLNIEGDSMTLENFSVADDIADQVDFITANASGNKEKNEATGVELTFDHRLSQIEVRAMSTDTTYTYLVTGVRIGRAEYMGTFNFRTNAWTLDSWHNTAIYDSYCDTLTLSATPQSIMGASGNAMLMPQKLYAWSPTADPDNVARDAYLSVLVRIIRKDNGRVMYPFSNDTITDGHGNLRQYAWASIPLEGTWEQGKKYIYTLDFSNGAGYVDPDDPTPGEPILGNIKFTVKVNPWIDSNSSLPMTTKK